MENQAACPTDCQPTAPAKKETRGRPRKYHYLSGQEIAAEDKKVWRTIPYDPTVGRLVCTRMAGGETLAEISKDLGIDRGNIWYWTIESDLFALAYARAQEARAELYAEEVVGLSDQADAKNHNAIRIRVDARKWVASKLLPHRYGERIEVNQKVDMKLMVVSYQPNLTPGSPVPQEAIEGEFQVKSET